jgi:hypothetical protein
MPTNTIGTAPGRIVAKRTLETLLEMYPFLPLIASDFSSESALYNQEIDVKMPSAFSTASDYTRANGYASSDTTLTDHPLTINKHKHITYDFDDLERTSHSIPLVEAFAGNAAHALGKALVDDLFAAVTVANYSNGTYYSPVSFGRSDIVNINKTLAGRKIPALGRIAVLNSDYFENISNDATLIANAGSQSDTVRSGYIGNVHGVRVEEYAQLPDNSEDLAGFVCIPEAIMLATRVPALPQDTQGFENVTDERTGLTLQMRTWYDKKTGLDNLTLTFMYGLAVGNADCLERIISVSP